MPDIPTEALEAGPIGVSAVVRLKRAWQDYPAGTYALVTGQAANGRDRYQVMIPGDPFPFTPHVSDLEVVQGVEGWWRRSKSPAFDAGVAAGLRRGAAHIYPTGAPTGRSRASALYFEASRENARALRMLADRVKKEADRA